MKSTNNAKTTPPKNRAIHTPITINVESVEDLPQIRTLPQDTLVPVNLKMSRKIAREIITKLEKQLEAPEEIDFAALSLIGVKP
jgi:hypothetical protein